ncbi:MAG: SDR family NAD(P)-dependent oxidoreductase [Myxococcota bacterium]
MSMESGTSLTSNGPISVPRENLMVTGLPPRLRDQVVVLAGSVGATGRYMARRMLREGARLAIMGESQEELDALVHELSSQGFDAGRILTVPVQPADPESCRKAIRTVVEQLGPIHSLVTDAGISGSRVQLKKIPFTGADLAECQETETMLDTARKLLGGPWNLVRAAVNDIQPGGSIVNISSIFSRTEYFGMIPYVVSKSGLNALSLGLARELGLTDRAIRVNTVFPGPIESAETDEVFANMDSLRSLEPGTSAKGFKDLMILRRTSPESDETGMENPTPEDLAGTVAWLASRDSSAFSGHAFEVTNGMQVPAQSRSKLVSWPDRRLVDLRGKVVLVMAGRNIPEALAFTSKHRLHGAEVVLAFRDLPSLERARAQIEHDDESPLPLLLCDPSKKDSVERSMQFLEDRYGRLDGVIILPAKDNSSRRTALSEMSDAEVDTFLQDEVVATVAFSSAIANLLERWSSLDQAPAITFVTNSDDGQGNHLNDVNRAAVEALIRVWRQEEAHDVTAGNRKWACVPNQLVRYNNSEPQNLSFSTDWTTTLTNRVRRMDAINLWVPDSIKGATGKSGMPLGIKRVLPGLHQGRTAVITGASGGIGLQLGRYLAFAGAKILLSARNPVSLEEARKELVEELNEIGYPEPEQRVFVMPNIDVGSEEALEELFQHSVKLFGHVDILINNAGIAGAEEMVVDMDVDAWNRTLETNLTSNYSLILKYSPLMKARGEGKILNISSYFGGEKYLAVAYPNRSDYSVSKAGQRALAEILSRHLGPEIQINSIAPGPVDGERLRGTEGRPGLFARRGRLILENKRLNMVHAAILDSARTGADVSAFLQHLAINRVDALSQWRDAPPALRKIVQRLSQSDPQMISSQYLMSGAIAPKLMKRLVLGSLIDWDTAARFLEAFDDGPVPFFSKTEVDEEAEKIGQGIIDRLHLHKMPTDEQVALSTVFYLADEIVSGDAYHPSGGLKFERSVTEGELVLHPGREDLQKLEKKNVIIIGECMKEELGELARAYASLGAAHIALVTQSNDVAHAIRHKASLGGPAPVSVHLVKTDVESALAEAMAEMKDGVHVVVSTPFNRLPLNPLSAEAHKSWDRVLSRDEFAQVIDDQLTHHFRVAKRAALQDSCQIVLVTPDTSRASTREEFALALFVKNSLHAFTVTLGVEGERLPTIPAVNQVQLTRRARTEEPSTDSEVHEEMERFVAAVLQCSIAAPSPKESRYLSRIYRGNAVTV